jgi:hypothetical protein
MTQDEARLRVKELAQGVLDGQLDSLLGCIEIDRIACRYLQDEIPPALQDHFSAVSSELDGLPIGAAREHWEPFALAVRDARVARYRAQVEAGVMEACARLLQVWPTSKLELLKQLKSHEDCPIRLELSDGNWVIGKLLHVSPAEDDCIIDLAQSSLSRPGDGDTGRICRIAVSEIISVAPA